MSGSNVIWKAGDSRSIKLTRRISDDAYEALNTKEMRVRSNRNKFIANAINSQTIIEFGTMEEKLRLIGVDDMSIIEQDKPVVPIIESNYAIVEEDVKQIKIDQSTESTKNIKKLFNSIPTK